MKKDEKVNDEKEKKNEETQEVKKDPSELQKNRKDSSEELLLLKLSTLEQQLQQFQKEKDMEKKLPTLTSQMPQL